MHGLDRRARVHVLEAVGQRVRLSALDQVGLGRKIWSAKAHLAARLLAVVQLLLACLASTSVMMDPDDSTRRSRRP